MAKTAILKSINDSVDLIELALNTLEQACNQQQLTVERVKKLYAVVDTQLLKIKDNQTKFEQKVKSWDSPTYFSKAKNFFKDKSKLENARKEAVISFVNVSKSVENFRQQYQLAKTLVKNHGINV